MTWEAWLTLAVVVGTVAVLARDLVPPALAMLGATVFLLVAGVIDAGQAFAGFSNQAPITVAALYVLARAVEASGAMEPAITGLLDAGQKADPDLAGKARRRQTRRHIGRLVLPVAGASAVLNNTPIVAAVAPEVQEWANRRGLSASLLLLPVSFAAILGGVVTVIGTSTNLVVSGLLADAGLGAIGMFEISRVGLPVALIGALLLVAIGPLLLPDRRTARESFGETVRQFSVAMRVTPGGAVDGRSVEDAGLRALQGVYCVQIDRDGETIAPVGPHIVLHGGDVLSFVGQVAQIVDLQRKRGLQSTEEHHLDEADGRRHAFFEAVIGADSPLVGHTLKQAGFRDRYRAAVLAIHRAGERVDAKLGQVPLQVGDTLLLLGRHNFGERWRESGDFLVVAPLGGDSPARTRKAPLVAAITVGLVVVAGSGLLPILEAALVAAFLLVATKVLTMREARDAVDLNVIVVIAAAFGLAAAMGETGLAETVAGIIVGGFSPLGEVGAMLGVLLATVLLTELITNNAAAALMFPIAVATAGSIGANPRGFAIGVAVAASASFLTPVGYQTNTIVYGLGGYRFTDYVRLGLPLTITVLATALVVIPLAWPL